MDMYHRLNQSFHYFPEGDEAYFALFNKIIYPLRFLMLNFESQHPFDNNILAMNTYKIMVLFAPPRLTLQRLEHVFQFLCNRMDQVFKTRGIYKALNEDFTHLPNRHSLSRWPEWQKIFEDKHHF